MIFFLWNNEDFKFWVIVYKKTDEWYIEWQQLTKFDTTSGNEWQQMTMSGIQRMTTSGTTSDNE